VFVFLAAWLLKEESFSVRKVMGLLLSFLGAGALILASAPSSQSPMVSSVSGDVMIMINAASYGIYLVLVRPLMQRYNTFTIIKWIFLLGSFPNIALGIGPLLHTPIAKFTWPVIGGITFLIVFATILAYALNAWAMKRLTSSAVGIYIYVQPIFVTLGSALFGLGEIGWATVPFIFLIFAGVWLVSRSPTETVVIRGQTAGKCE
jgi:drug/metabolite transporter (DMT)-like permease